MIAQCLVWNLLALLEVVERTSAGLERAGRLTVVIDTAIVLANKDSDVLKLVLDE